MGFFSLLALAAGLSMDAFAAAVCKGLSIRRPRRWDAVAVGLYFGLFQALMPLLGCVLGSAFSGLAVRFDHWVAFLLLGLIGGSMVAESFSPPPSSPDEICGPSLAWRQMVPLALATSVDALAVGVTFAFLQTPILPAACLIGAVAFLLSVLGVKLGSLFGARHRAWAERLGGAVLMLIGLKILLEHLAAA